jgi:pantoate--beta-alanine ligase
LTLLYTLNELTDWRNGANIQEKKIGFVPTMGALHAGHISLIERSLKENDVTIASIFINPTQFNDPKDFVNYPQKIEADLALLKSYSDLLLFIPSTDEMYPTIEKEVFHCGLITSTLEAKQRPGHFDGVITIIRKLFDNVQAHHVYLGEKDFQQLAVIRAWVKLENRNEIIVPCPTIREEDGLAMSSRNLRLTPEQRKQAPLLYQALRQVQAQMGVQSPSEAEIWVRSIFQQHTEFKLDYFEIIDGNSFGPLTEWEDSTLPVALIAAYMGEVRLIDNLPLTEQEA